MNSPPSPGRSFDELIRQAQALPPEKRAAFLDVACSTDAQLRRDVELHLARHEQTGSWQPEGRPAQPSPEGLATHTFEAGSTGEARFPGGQDLQPDAPELREEELLPLDAGRGEAGPIGQLGEYDILAKIGRGGMGIVYKARHRVLERLVAIKIPRAATLAKGEERFLREAKSAAALRHPHICPIYEVGHSGRHPFIAFGYIEGTTLRRWTRRKQPNARLVAETVAKVARAVQYAHEHGIVHRDIKPSNVMVDGETGEPVLMDFGLAKLLSDHDSQVTKSGEVMGTPVYMAPEQAAGRTDEVGPLSDVYAVGAVLYELLTGRPPFDGPAGEVIYKVQCDAPPPPRKLNPATHRDLETICLKAMAKASAARYPSAGALAEDLERFAAGEPILARREGIVARGRRLLVRNRSLMASVLVVAVLAGGAVAYFASGARTAQTVAGLTRSVNDGLQQRDWPAGHLAAMERRIAELEPFDPQAAADFRGQLHQAVAARVRDEIAGRASLGEEDLGTIEARIAWLGPRAADLVPPLREQLRRRLRVWQEVFQLAAPYERLDEVFSPEQVQREDGQLLPDGPADLADQPAIPAYRVLTKIPSHGHVQLTAVFRFDAGPPGPVGLLLHAVDNRGYLFRVRPPRRSPDGRGAGAPPAANAMASSETTVPAAGAFEIEILRDGRLLRQRSATVRQLFDSDTGTLSLTATVEDGRVTFVAGRLPALAFEDVFLHTGSPAHRFGLLWPPAVPLVSLEALRQPLPATPSPLEQGDELFAREQWDAALAHYREQVGRARGELPRDQARFKEALCLLQLGQEDAAAEILHALAVSEDERMRVLAACQLWLVRLRRQQYDEADAVFRSMQARYDFKQLALMVPEEDRRNIVSGSYEATTGTHSLRFSAADMRFLERAHGAAELLVPDEGPEAKAMRYWQLLRAYHLVGEHDKGIQLARNHLDALGRFPGGMATSVAVEYSWLLRQRGQSGRALQVVNRCLNDSQGRDAWMLLLERARIHALRNDWDLAEKDVDVCLSVPVQELHYQEFSAACLLRGFLHWRRGEEEQARAAWERGRYPNWLAQREAPPPGGATLTGMPASHAILLGALSEKVTGKEALDLLAAALPVGGDGVTDRLFQHYLGSFDHYLGSLESAMIGMVRDERGLEVARQIAFQEVSFRQYISSLAALLAVEMARQGASSGEWSDEEFELIWQSVHDILEEYNQQRLAVAHGVQLLLTWRGATDIFGWRGVAGSLRPEVRGPIAYVFGHRYRRLGKPEEAETFFRIARDDAPTDSPLHRLAAAQLRDEP